jgi:glycosyltransferase involved in cell wall biosynthesis
MNIEFIIPSYNRPNELMTIVGSILSQKSKNWYIHIISDGPDNTAIPFIEYIINRNPEKIRHSVLNGPHKDWGHTAREYGIYNSKEEWIVMTGDDNYYSPLFVEYFLDIIEKNSDINFLFCNMLHDHYHHRVIFETNTQPGKIDIGCFTIKSDIAKEVGYHQKERYDADWVFVENYLKKYNSSNIAKIPFCLYVHN